MRKKHNKEKNENQIPKALKEMKKDNEKLNKKEKFKVAKKQKRKKIKRIIISVITIIIVIVAINIGISTHRWKMLAKDMIVNQNSIVKDTDGNTIASLGSNKKKKIISSEQIPANLKNAYVAIEDERFYSHNGIDIKRTTAAIGSYIIHFGSSSYGGSTITQQFVKNLTGDSTDTVTRKIKEWWKAVQLENCVSKDDILSSYLNVIYVGPNIYGVEGGAKYYFNKSVNQLTLEECAFLAGINNSPNAYNPFSDKDTTEKIKKRTKIVLSKMKELGYITDESEYNTAVQKVESGIKFKKGNIEANDRHIFLSYRCTYTRNNKRYF